MAHRGEGALIARAAALVLATTLGAVVSSSGALGAAEGAFSSAPLLRTAQRFGTVGARRALLAAPGTTSTAQQQPVPTEGPTASANDVTPSQAPKCGLPKGALEVPQDRLPPWRPRPNRYLLAYCHRSGWTNRLFCTQRALVMAALLNRTLVLGTLDPCRSTKRGDAAERMIDVLYMRRCLRTGVLEGTAELPQRCTPRGAAAASNADSDTAAAANATAADPSASDAAGAASATGGAVGAPQDTAASSSGSVDAVKAAVGPRGMRLLELDPKASAVLQAAEEQPGMGVISLEEYLCMHGVGQLKVDLLLCMRDIGDVDFCPPRSCDMAGRVLFPWPTHPPVNLYDWYHGDPAHHSVTYPLNDLSLAVVDRVSKGAPVLSLGDTFHTHHLHYAPPVSQSTSEMFGVSCGILLRPPLEVFGQAAEFVANVFQGQPYASVHLRRGDFAEYCRGTGKCKYPSVKEIATWLSKELGRQGLKNVFVASNGKLAELQRLSGHLAARGITMAMLQPRLGWSDGELSPMEWFANGRPSRGFNSLDLVDHMLCAKAQTYYFSHGSSFSLRIMQIRDGLGARSCEDKLLCADCS